MYRNNLISALPLYIWYTHKGCVSKYSKTCLKRPLSKRPHIGFQDQLSLNACQKYCRMIQGEHSAILSTFIKLPFVIKIFVLSIFEWLFYTSFTVLTGFMTLQNFLKSINLNIANFPKYLFLFLYIFDTMIGDGV